MPEPTYRALEAVLHAAREATRVWGTESESPRAVNMAMYRLTVAVTAADATAVPEAGEADGSD